MLKLHYVPMTRSNRPRWMLEELGVPYQLARMAPADTKSAEYLKIHPLGKVPALQDGDRTIIESAAIVLWLADRYPDKGFAPPPGSPERGAYYQWILYAMATLEPAVAAVAYHTRLRPEEKRVALIAEEGRAAFAEAAAPLEALLRDRPYLLGDAFSAADVVLGAVVLWGSSAKLLEGFPALQAYCGRLKARPAFQRARHD